MMLMTILGIAFIACVAGGTTMAVQNRNRKSSNGFIGGIIMALMPVFFILAMVFH